MFITLSINNCSLNRSNVGRQWIRSEVINGQISCQRTANFTVVNVVAYNDVIKIKTLS